MVVLLPWALPTVVAALVWRFMFESQGDLRDLLDDDWLSRPFAAWVPIVLGDVWKSTPFVALLFARRTSGESTRACTKRRGMDGAGRWRRFTQITLPRLMPTITVGARVQDDGRVPRFRSRLCVDSGADPDQRAEVISLYAFTTLLQDLRFGLRVDAVDRDVRAHVRARARIRAIAAHAGGRRVSRPDRSTTAAVALLIAAWAFPLIYARLVHHAGRTIVRRPIAHPHGSQCSFTIRPSSPSAGFWVPIVNSLVVAGNTTMLAVVIGAPAAYAMHDFAFEGGISWLPPSCRSPCSADCDPLAALPDPPCCAPDQYLPRPRAPYMTFSMPLAIWLLAAFFRQLPRDLEEAAMMDGASRARPHRICLPLAAPGVATTAILTFLYAWNEFLFALVVHARARAPDGSVAIALFRGRYRCHGARCWRPPLSPRARRRPGPGVPAADRQRLTAGAVKG